MLCNCNLVSLSPFQLFRTPLPRPQPFCNHPFVFCIFEFVFILLFKFYIWVRLCGICVSLWLTSLSIKPSRSVCVVTSGKILPSFMTELCSILCVCVCVCAHACVLVKKQTCHWLVGVQADCKPSASSCWTNGSSLKHPHRDLISGEQLLCLSLKSSRLWDS